MWWVAATRGPSGGAYSWSYTHAQKTLHQRPPTHWGLLPGVGGNVFGSAFTGKTCRLQVEFAKLSGRFAETEDWDDGGFYSPLHWIRVNCHLGSGAAWDRINVGEHRGQRRQEVERLDPSLEPRRG
jgi:hypothetical protein